MRLTPKDLVLRLRAAYNVTTDEDLARVTGISLRTITRWKSKDKPGEMPLIVQALNFAGLLQEGEPAAELHPEESPSEVAQIAALEERVAALEALVQVPKSGQPEP